MKLSLCTTERFIPSSPAWSSVAVKSELNGWEKNWRCRKAGQGGQMVCYTTRALKSCLLKFACVQNPLQPTEAEPVFYHRNKTASSKDMMASLTWIFGKNNRAFRHCISRLYYVYLKLSSNPILMNIAFVWQPTHAFVSGLKCVLCLDYWLNVVTQLSFHDSLLRLSEHHPKFSC